jgi:hypothetical protein
MAPLKRLGNAETSDKKAVGSGGEGRKRNSRGSAR